jgi:mono/diheme cytochrome c family protein
MRPLVTVTIVLMVLAIVVTVVVFRPHLPAAERGRRLAQRTGCFTCHGPGGIRGAANPGRSDKSVPGFEGDVMMYAKSAREIAAWIRDGTTPGRAASRTWREQRRRGALRMPAFGTRLSSRQIDDLVAYVLVMSGSPEPSDSLPRRGLERAEALGCTGCHGPGGRLAPPNPGSLKGYVPSWDGGDFDELVRGRPEFGEWVEHGISDRMKANPVARWFLQRATLHMPPFREHLAPGDLDALWAYVRWLRSYPGAGSDTLVEGSGE